ncbi:MAG: leucine-rich repeat protein [Oscillospiraceae bacterium]|nr:leucine-rich repeat protein [Oscillospiraceae bacterium]
MGTNDFGWCTGLTSVTIPDSVTSIGESAFEGCESLSNVAIPDSVTNIGKKAFASCAALTRVAFPDGLITIGDYSFYNCRSIENVTIPNSVSSIGQGAFSSCNKLERVTIGNGVTYIGDYAFNNCYALTYLELGSSVNSIGDNAFYWCPYLTSVQIPPSVTSIGEYAFGYYNENHYKVDDFTIFGSPGTAAQTYAEENGFRFGGTPCVVTVNPPMAGCHPATTGISADPSHYKVTAVAFHPMSGYYEGDALTPDDTFTLGTTYRVWVRLTGTGGYTLTDDTLATINGILATSHGVSMGGDAWYTVDMAAEEMPVCEVTVTPPMPGQHPVSTGESADPSRFTVYRVTYAPVTGDSFGATLSESEAFTPNQVYRVFVVLWPKGDWGGFTEDTPVTINGIAATFYGALTGRGMYYVDMKCENPFVDVHESDWFFNPVMWAVGQTVTGGTDETHFSPAKTVLRSDAMVFFWAANGRPTVEAESNPFQDVSDKHWAHKAVMWAVKNGITGGTSPNTFSPSKTCSRSEILQFLYASMGKPEYTIGNPYSDINNSQWYYDGAIWAYENRLEKGEGGKFNAQTPCTRAYVVTYLYRFFTGKELAE